MTAVINPRPIPTSAPVGALSESSKPVFIAKVGDHVARVTDVWLLARQDGVWTASEDKLVKLFLKRDNGTYWHSIAQLMPTQVTCIFYDESDHLPSRESRLLVGLLNGHVYMFSVAEDLNSMQELRHFAYHTGPIAGLALDTRENRIYSCSRDKTISFHCSETGMKLGNAAIDNSCACMLVVHPFVFIGDNAGSVHMLRVDENNLRELNKLSAHTGTVTCLAFDVAREMLFSGSADNLIIMWDIGGGKGDAYELTGHTSRLTCLSYSAASRRLFSADDTGKLMIWDMNVSRIVTPPWSSADVCEICESPFFWNIAAMWQKRVVGNRQHHCRICGRAACANCCSTKTTYPPMGFEIPVRICKACQENKEKYPERYSLTPLAIGQELRYGVVAMQIQDSISKMVTVLQNRSVMLHDIAAILKGQ